MSVMQRGHVLLLYAVPARPRDAGGAFTSLLHRHQEALRQSI